MTLLQTRAGTLPFTVGGSIRLWSFCRCDDDHGLIESGRAADHLYKVRPDLSLAR
jgi:hypothetical protein